MPKALQLVNPKLVAAMKHPTRNHALIVLNERTLSVRDIAEELGETRSHVRYHLNMLLELKAIEAVRHEPGYNGHPETYYRALIRSWIGQEAWLHVDPKDQSGPTAAIFASMNVDIGNAIVGGTINDRNNHISRSSLVLDEESYEELLQLLSDSLDGIMEIQERAANRLQPGARGIVTKVHMIQFVSPDPKADEGGI